MEPNTMERLSLTIETGNAAFTESPTGELARILRDTADKLERGDILDSHPLRDINGNRVGLVTITKVKENG
jgi:hypothetical protein